MLIECVFRLSKRLIERLFMPKIGVPEIVLDEQVNRDISTVHSDTIRIIMQTFVRQFSLLI